MIEPDRTIEGIVAALEKSVLPSLASGFARGQLFAVLEVLGGLLGQLSWGGPIAESEADSLVELMSAVSPSLGGPIAARVRDFAAAPPLAVAERIATGRALLCELIDSGLADDGELRSAVDSHLANDTLRRAMALRPSRLAEISQG
ncbi:MAG TPA: hypothetical protein VGK20_13820 [Candidatus Binatia bacterium]